jgi:SNF2 family DNA or RNA helicase
MGEQHVYNVGDKVHHTDFGEGLVVEIRDRQLFDILEVVFPSGVRRLSSLHPLLRPQPTLIEEPPPKPKRRRRRRRLQQSPGESRLDFLTLDEGAWALLDRVAEGDAEPFEDFLLHLEAEDLAARRGFENLLCLDQVHHVDQLEYQKLACLRVLREMRGRALLADEVGLGKTIEAGLVLKEYLLRGLVQRALVLVPASLTSQWREELASKFDLDFAVAGRRGGWEEHPLLICSLDTAKTARNRSPLLERSFDLVIVDEAHRLRNHQTLAWKFVAALNSKYLLLLTATPVQNDLQFVAALNSKYLLLLTATPVQNDLRELFNLINLLRPGTLGTYRGFRRRYMVRGDKRLPKNTTELSQLLRNVMIRTTRAKTNIKFPRRSVHIVPFRLTGRERDLYDAVTEFVRDRFIDQDRTQFIKWHFVSMVLQKEIGSSTPAALHTLRRARKDERYRMHHAHLNRLYELGESVDQHAKLDGLLHLLENHRGKAIVFTQFKSTLQFLAGVLRDCGYSVSVFHGGLNTAEKDAAVEAFRDRTQILVSTEAGGEGRNLHFCQTVINYDLPWNPMKVEQRIGRVHRLGQTGDINIYNFSTENTVESHVLEILHRKINMFELVIGEMDMILGDFSDTQSFESTVFQIWAGAKSRRDLEKQFRDLGDQLALSRRRYESIKRLDEEIFNGE